MCIQVSVIFPYDFVCLQGLYCYSFNYLTLAIYVFPLFLVILARSLSILLNFSKNQLLVSLFLFFCLQFHWFLLSSYFCPSWFGFILLYFSSFWGRDLDYWSETSFLGQGFSAVTLPLSTAVGESHKCSCCVFILTQFNVFF